MNNSFSELISAFVAFMIPILIFLGWGLNIYKFAVADFETPYKTEIIRGIGIGAYPFGVIIGFMDIGEENNN